MMFGFISDSLGRDMNPVMQASKPSHGCNLPGQVVCPNWRQSATMHPALPQVHWLEQKPANTRRLQL